MPTDLIPAAPPPADAPPLESPLEIGAWIGRQQAFAMVASHCSAAQAECLRRVRESAAYEQLNLTWEEFCLQHAGITRSYADKLIRRLDEFGPAYFKLAQLARISPATFREIAGHVHPDSIEFDGESIPLLPENGPRIRTLLRHFQYRAQQAEAKAHSSVSELTLRLNALLKEVARCSQYALNIEHYMALRGLCERGVSDWRKALKVLESSKPV